MTRRRGAVAATLGLGLGLALGGGRDFAVASHPARDVREVWSQWLQKHGLAAPEDSWLDTALLWRAQRLGLSWPLHAKLVSPYLEGGPQAGDYDEMYTRWRAAGLFEQMESGARRSAGVDLNMQDDYDKFLSLWAGRLKREMQPWPEDADTALNFAITAYEKQMEDPSLFAALREAIPLDEAKQREASEWEDSVQEQLTQNQKRFSADKLKDFDSLFIGHSHFHAENPFQLWQDASLALKEAFPDRCQRPLYNDIGNFHPEDLAANLLGEPDEAQLAKRVPLRHFDLVAAVHVIPWDQGFRRIRQLLKPGGILIWNTWWRREGEHPGGRAPDLTDLGFTRLKDKALPLSFVTSPFKQSGFTYRYCYARLRPEKKGFR